MEQIGLEGVFKTEAFASGLNKYTSGLTKAVTDTGHAGGAMGDALAGGIKIGITALAGLTVAAATAAVAVSGTILAIAMKAGEASHALEILAAKTNLSTTALQEWNYAGQFLGVTADDIATAFYRLSNAAYMASHSGKTANEQLLAFQQLGLNIYGVGGKLKDTNLLFEQALDALKKIKDPTLQDALAMKIFGRGVQDLMPLIKLGSKGIEELRMQAHEMGAVMSEEDVAAFATFDDTLDMIKSSIGGMSKTFVAQFLPALQDVADNITLIMYDINAGMRTGGDFSALLTDVPLILDAYMKGIAKAIPLFVGKFQQLIGTVQKYLVKNLPLFVKNGTAIVAALIKGIGPALTSLGLAAIDIAGTIIKALEDSWPDLMEAGRTLFSDLGQGIEAGLSTIQQYFHLPSVGGILTWIFGKATEYSAKFKTWVDSVNWTQLSQDVAAAISGLPWSGIGSSMGGGLAGIAKNIWGALHDAIFGHPVTTMNMDTHQMETNLVGGIDWAALGIALGAAFDNAVIGALHTGLKLGDVTDLAGLQAEWSSIGEQYGKIAGTDMAPKFWQELWKAVTVNSPNAGATPVEGLFNFFTLPGQIDLIFGRNFSAEMKQSWDDLMSYFGSGKVWSDLVAQFQAVGFPLVKDAFSGLMKWFIDSVKIWGTEFSNTLNDYFVKAFNQIIIDMAIAWNKLMALVGGTPIDLSTLAGAPSGETPSGTGTGSGNGNAYLASVPNRTGYSAPLGAGSVSNAKSVVNNITVNNPSAEPASASVDGTMRRMNYLGYDS